jgi:hypothetical protein
LFARRLLRLLATSSSGAALFGRHWGVCGGFQMNATWDVRLNFLKIKPAARVKLCFSFWEAISVFKKLNSRFIREK